MPLRYRMLETVREFGRMQLIDAGEEDDARRAHRDWAVAVADVFSARLFTRDQVATVDQVAVEENNLADALRRALAEADADAVVALVATLGGFWSIRGEHPRVIMICEPVAAVLTSVRAAPERADQARAAICLTLINSWFSQLGALEALVGELAALGPGTTSRRIAAMTTVVLGASGTTETPMLSPTDALVDDPDPQVRSIALQWRSHERENVGDAAGAIAAAEAALAAGTDEDGPWTRAVLHAQLAGLYSQMGRIAEAEPHARAAVPVLLRLGAHDDALEAMTVSAIACLERGDPDAAQRVLDEALALTDQPPSGYSGRGTMLITRAEIAFARGEVDDGCRMVEEAADAMAAISFPGMGDDADIAPWRIYGNTVAVVALAVHGREARGRERHPWLADAARRVLDREPGFVDVPVVGLMLFALGSWGLTFATMPPADAVRLLALADRMSYPRFVPSLSWPRAVERCEAAAPGELDRLAAEYGERRGLDLLAETRGVIARLYP
jgi:tetratricopeptide (TPR) repeat protein